MRYALLKFWKPCAGHRYQPHHNSRLTVMAVITSFRQFFDMTFERINQPSARKNHSEYIYREENCSQSSFYKIPRILPASNMRVARRDDKDKHQFTRIAAKVNSFVM